jgi:hypothetical protein
MREPEPVDATLDHHREGKGPLPDLRQGGGVADIALAAAAEASPPFHKYNLAARRVPGTGPREHAPRAWPRLGRGFSTPPG